MLEIASKLQKGWESIEAKGAELGGDEVLNALQGTNIVVTIEVPGDQDLGVKVEDRTITKVMRPELGWKEGDRIFQVNDGEVKNQDEVIAGVEKAKKAKSLVRIMISRAIVSPFLKLENVANEIYSNAPPRAPLIEPEEMSQKLRDLKNKADLASKGIVEMSGVRKKLDVFVAELTKYVAA